MKITELHIWEKNSLFKNLQNNMEVNTYDIILKRSIKKNIDLYNKKATDIMKDQQKKVSLYSIKKINNTKSIKLFYKNWKEVKLPLDMEKKLLTYIKTQHDINTIIWNNRLFDCTAFVHFINWVPYKKNTYDNSLWEIRDYDREEQLNIWDTILSWAEHDSFNIKFKDNFHFSIYLWQGLFIWKTWSIWNLTVFDLEWLSEVYPFEKWEIVQLIPKKNHL